MFKSAEDLPKKEARPQANQLRLDGAAVVELKASLEDGLQGGQLLCRGPGLGFEELQQKRTNLDTLPFGLSRYSTGISTILILCAAAWIVISVSISNPLDNTGKVLTNCLEKARLPVIISLTSTSNKVLINHLTIRFPLLWNNLLVS